MNIRNRIAMTAAVLACAAAGSLAQVRAAGAEKGTINVKKYLLGDGNTNGGASGTTSNNSNALWDNGPDDRVIGILSTRNAHADSEAADDCWLKEGMWYDVEYVVVRMAVTQGYEPETTLYAYADCDGRPDDSVAPAVYSQDEWYVVDPNPTGEFAGTQIWEIAYYIDEFVHDEQLRWLSPVHTGGGLAFWVSANSGKVQGRQAQLRSADFGLPDWTDADKELCCGICTDYYMQVIGKCCWRVLEQSDYDLDGLTNPIYAQNHPWTRTLDDFQLAEPCGDPQTEFGICRIDAYFATNCDLTTVYGEFYNNECDMPADLTIGLLRIAPERFEPTGETVAGLPVYKVTFICPPGTLYAGQNYWFSIFSEQGAFVGKRSVWLFRHRDDCNFRINPGKFFYPAIGIDPALPISALPLGPGVDREFAYSVWVCRPMDMMYPGDGEASPIPSQQPSGLPRSRAGRFRFHPAPSLPARSRSPDPKSIMHVL
ncbi:MAG: hypothetical protein R3B49_02645 [Phycisphaerales bacterium]